MRLFCTDDRTSQTLLISGDFPESGINLFCLSDVETQPQPLFRLPVITPTFDACAILKLRLDGVAEISVDSDAESSLAVGDDALVELVTEMIASATFEILLDSEMQLDVTELCASLILDQITAEKDLVVLDDSSKTLQLAQSAYVVLQVDKEATGSLNVSDTADMSLDVEDVTDEC